MSENNVRKVAINTTINGQEMDILVSISCPLIVVLIATFLTLFSDI